MKFPLLILSLVFSCAVLVHAEGIRRIGLDGKEGIPAPEQEEGKDGIARIKHVDPPSLELFPTVKKPAHGTVLISPGGGYSILAITHEGRNVAKMLNDAGWDAAVLLYRVSAGPQTRELAFGDVKAALTLLRTRGTEFGLATANLGVLGFSAGGHLTARLAHEASATEAPQFVVLMYPAYLEKDGKILADVAPVKAPTFLYVAADDGLTTSSVAYATACEEKHIRVELHQPASGGHGFGLLPELGPNVRDWPAKLRAFLETVSATGK